MGQFGNFYRALNVSLTATNQDFVPYFDAATGSSFSASLVSMGSASAEFSQIVGYVHQRLSEPILTVELTPSQIAVNLNAAIFRFSYFCNSYFIQSHVASVLGIGLNYTQQDFQRALPAANNTFLNAFMANQENTGLYNQNTNKRKGYINYNMNEQRKDIYTYGMDAETGLSLDEYVASVTGYGVHFVQIYYTQGGYMNRLYDPNTNQQFIQAEFGFPSFPTDTVFYILPLWQDIQRGRLLADSDLTRKSAYRHSVYGRTLELIPKAKQSCQIWFDYYVDPKPATGLSPLQQSSFSGLAYLTNVADNAVATNFGNVPIKDLSYETMNPVGRSWVREYTLALCMRTLAFTRGKVPWRLADGTQVTLNDAALLAEANNLENKLEAELKERLAAMDAYEIIRKETEKAEEFQRYLRVNSPMPVMRTKGY